MSALLVELETNRETLTLGERVALRRRIDAEDGVTYPAPNMYQVAALSRLMASVAGGTGAGHGSALGRALPTN